MALVPRLRTILALVLSAAVLFAGWIWWWHHSGSLRPLADPVDTPTGRYRLGPALPVARTEAGGAACDGKLWVVGGIDAWGRTLTSVMAYDPARGAWEALPDLPVRTNHPGVVCADGRLWVLGGFGPLGLRPRGVMLARWDPRSDVWSWHVRERRWVPGPPMPEPRGGGGVAFAGGALWYAGGIDAERRISADLFRLDPGTGEWRRMPSMAVPRDHLRMEAVGDALYAIGGREDDLRRNLGAVERYGIDQDAWSRVAALPTPRGGLSSAVLGDRIYAFGGEDVWSAFADVEVYDPVTDHWRVLDPLPEGRHGIVAGVLGERIHLVGGGRHSRISISGIHRIFAPSSPTP